MSDPPNPHHGFRKKDSSDPIVDDSGSQLTSASDTDPRISGLESIGSPSTESQFNDMLMTSGTNLSDPSTSSPTSIITTKPFDPLLSSTLSSDMNSGRKSFQKSKATGSAGKRQVLPGLFTANSYDKYITFTLGENRSFADTNVFDIHRDIVRCLGRKPKITPQGETKLLIEVVSQLESTKLLSLNKVVGVTASCVPHPYLNQCRGIVYCRELLDYSEAVLLEELSSQYVVGVKRIKKRVNGELQSTPLLLLTFQLLSLPSSIAAAWYVLPVRHYVPSPKRCFHCQLFGHGITTCRRRLKGHPAICVNCGEIQHGDCDKLALCYNCHGPHSAADKTCPHYQTEKEVLDLHIKEKLSYREARQQIKNTFRPGTSYASAAKKPVCSQNAPSFSKSRAHHNVTSLSKRRRSDDPTELPSAKSKSPVASLNPASDSISALTEVAPVSGGASAPLRVAPACAGASAPSGAAPACADASAPSGAAPVCAGASAPSGAAPVCAGASAPSGAAPVCAGASVPLGAVPADTSAPLGTVCSPLGAYIAGASSHSETAPAEDRTLSSPTHSGMETDELPDVSVPPKITGPSTSGVKEGKMITPLSTNCHKENSKSNRNTTLRKLNRNPQPKGSTHK